eukprot:1274777-Prymnesium_polylepis.1
MKNTSVGDFAQKGLNRRMDPVGRYEGCVSHSALRTQHWRGAAASARLTGWERAFGRVFKLQRAHRPSGR